VGGARDLGLHGYGRVGGGLEKKEPFVQYVNEKGKGGTKKGNWGTVFLRRGNWGKTRQKKAGRVRHTLKRKRVPTEGQRSQKKKLERKGKMGGPGKLTTSIAPGGKKMIEKKGRLPPFIDENWRKTGDQKGGSKVEKEKSAQRYAPHRGVRLGWEK